MKTGSKKKIIITIALVVAVLAGLAIFLNKFLTTKVADSGDSTNTAVVEKADINLKIFGRGVLRPADQYEVKSLVKGEVLTADYNEGDKVQKGDILFSISQEEVEGQVTGAEIGVKKVENLLEALQEQTGELKAVSSIGGTITGLNIKKGDNVSSGQVIGEVIDTDRLKLTAYFPKEEAKNISSGSSAEVLLDATGEALSARVVSVGKDSEIVSGGINAVAVKLEIKGNLNSLVGAAADARVGSVESVKGGSLEAGDIGSIVAKASGQVTEVRFSKGDRVSAGTVIATLSSKELSRQIESAKLDIEQSKTSLNDAKRRQKSYAVTAPIEGTLVRKNKKVGDVIDPSNDGNSGGLAVIYDLSSLKLTLNIDELDVLKIQKGQTVDIEAAALPGQKFSAVVENVSMQGNAEAGVTTYPVTVRIDEIGALMPGMNVTGNIHAASLKSVLSVPSACLQRGNKLFIKDDTAAADPEGGIDAPPAGFRAVEVEVGINDGDRVEIKSGIKEGDVIYLPDTAGDSESTESGIVID